MHAPVSHRKRQHHVWMASERARGTALIDRQVLKNRHMRSRRYDAITKDSKRAHLLHRSAAARPGLLSTGPLQTQCPLPLHQPAN